MKRKYMPVYLLLLILFGGTQELQAQDPNFSQYFTSPVTLNPAMIGKGVSDMRLSGIFRSQWWGSSNVQPFYTSAISFEKKILSAKTGTNTLAMSLSILSDASNAGLLKNNYFSFGTAYSKSLDANGEELLSGGLSVTYANLLIDASKLEFQTQLGSNGFNPSSPSNDFVSIVSNHYIDVNAGIHYSKTEKKFGYDIGAAIFHAGSPSLGSYNDENYKLKPRFSLQGGVHFYLSDKNEVHISNVAELQALNNFYIFGGAFKLNTGHENISFITIGIWNRFGDALYPYLAIEGKEWVAGITYDIITSQVRTSENQIQSSEFSFTWKFGKTSKKLNPSILIY